MLRRTAFIILCVALLAACQAPPGPRPTRVELLNVPIPPTSPVTRIASPTADVYPQLVATPNPASTLVPSLTSPVTTIPETAAPPTTPFCSRPAEVVSKTYPSAVAGGAQKVNIFLPPCYGDDGRVYPALYLFGGNIHDETTWDTLGLSAYAAPAMSSGELPPFLVIMPEGGFMANNTSGGPYSYEGVIMQDLIPFVEATYCAWAEPAGRAIGGLSRGGYWALEIAFRHPDYFQSVGGHSAALLDTSAGPAFNPQYTGLSSDLTDLRIYLDIGADDWVRHNIERLHNEMTNAGRAHTWVLNEGAHEEAYWAANLPNYLAWYADPWPHERNLYPHCPLAE